VNPVDISGIVEIVGKKKFATNSKVKNIRGLCTGINRFKSYEP
jgi:hypothetical protein